MQEVKRILISQIEPDGKVQDALDEVNENAIMAGDLARAVVKVHDGVTLYFYPTATSRPLNIKIGQTTAQDLNLDLGPPLRIHYKEDGRMTIHAATRGVERNDEAGYFYNYFQYGLDFLISETTHIVKKIVLHTNVTPPHGSASLTGYSFDQLHQFHAVDNIYFVLSLKRSAISLALMNHPRPCCWIERTTKII